MTTILLADDHRIFRDGLRPLLSAQPELQVVAEAEDGLEALRLGRERQPDIAVLDISMPGLNGIEVARRLAIEAPRVQSIVLSMHNDRRFVLEALRAGARGYLLKDDGILELLEAIRTVRSGETYLCAAVAQQVIQEFVNLADADQSSVFTRLSPRETRSPADVGRGRVHQRDRGTPDPVGQDRRVPSQGRHGQAGHPQHRSADQVRHPRRTNPPRLVLSVLQEIGVGAPGKSLTGFIGSESIPHSQGEVAGSAVARRAVATSSRVPRSCMSRRIEKGS